MTEKPKVYLAGPIQHADDGGHGWRDDVIEATDEFEWLNPLDKHDGGEAFATIMPERFAENYEPADDELVITDREIVEADKELIDTADAILIGFDEKVPAWGTPMEQAYVWDEARDKSSIPVVVYHGPLPDDELSPWLRYHSDYRVPELSAALNHLRNELLVEQ